MAFLGRTLLWLVPCLAGWYFAATWIGWLPAKLASPVIAAVAGEARATSVRERVALYEVRIQPSYELLRAGAEPVLAEIEVATATYTYGLALFLALSLASPESRRTRPILAGFAIAWIACTWGIAFDALKQLAVTPTTAAYLSLSGTAREAIVFGYQVGSLLLPTLLPVGLWLALNRKAWRD